MKRIIRLLPLLLVILMMPSCEVVEGIFKIGFWAGIIVVALVVALIFWIVRKLR